MSSIDERIVSIKFNNAQFEAGIKTTMTSLDGLKKTLNFEAGVKALGDLDAAGKKVAPPKFDGKAFSDGVQTTISATNNLKNNLKFDGAVKGLNDLDAAGKKVNLKLDPTPFQMGAKGVIDAATTIKQNLNFESVQRGIGGLKTSVQNISFQSVIDGSKNAARSLADLDLAGKAVNFLPISDGAQKAQQSISTMSIAGIAAIGALAFKAASAGADMAKSLFIDPAKSGLAEYETNLGSIQTIMSNTQWENKSLGDVNGALDELNAYSDKTIYNFAEMAKNIGTFTSAGVKLDDSTQAIKGIANLAAVSGSNSEQASSAMYQLSQAMAAGKVGLQDWNSVVNAGMGGKVFQDALMETARNQGTNVDGLIKKHGSFRESLQEGWITSKVLNETLSKMTGDLTDEQLKAMGYNDQQIVGIQQMAKTAQDAATKIKTFSQLTGTLTEITGSGWATSWKLILGDFEQAKEMWTNVYKVLGEMVQGTADARNKMLGDWNKAGGRTEMIGAVSAAFKVLMGVLTPIKEAFREVFPPTTGQQLFEITRFIRLFIEALIPGEQATALLKNSFKLLFTIIKIGVDIIKGALGVVFAFFKAFATGGDSIAGSMKPLTDALGEITKKIQESKVVEQFFGALTKAATFLGNAIRKVVEVVANVIVPFIQLGIHMYSLITWSTLFAHYFGLVGDVIDIAGSAVMAFLQYLGNLSVAFRDAAQAFMKGGLEAAIASFRTSLTTMGNIGEVVFSRITERIESIKRFAGRLADAWDQVAAAMSRMWDKLLPLRTAVSDLFRDLGEKLKGVFADVNYDDTLDMVNTGLLAGLVLLFKSTFKKMLGMGDGVKDALLEKLTTSVESINGVLEGVQGTLEAMQQNLKADTLMKIAIAIGILAISVIALSLIDSGKLTKALVAIGVMVVILTKAMEALDKITMSSGFLKIPVIAASMILLAIALALLTIPVVILSRLSWNELLKGLAGVAVLLAVLSKTVESMAQNPADLIATGVGLMAIAVAVRILADAVTVMGALDLGSLVKGLGGVSVVLFALSKTVDSMSKNPADLIATGIGIVAIAIGIKILSSAVSDFGSLDINTILKGILALGVVLLILENFTKNVGDAKNIIQTAAAMLILGVAMKVIASAMGDFGSMEWESIAKGLLVMAVALKAISEALERTPKNIFTSALGFVVVAAALKLLGSALKDFAEMSWEDIAKAMTVLAGSLLILSIALILMEDTLPGAYAMGIAAASMVLMAMALTMFGSLSWEQLLVGLAALAGIFILFGLAGLVLAPVVPVLIALGIAMVLIGAGLVGIGFGMAAFVAGLIALTAAGLALGPAMVIIVGSILALIPMAMAELGKGIVAFADVIGGAMPTFLNAFVALLTTLLTAIQMVFPQLMETLWMVIVGLVDLVVRGVPMFVDAGMKIIIGILQGIGNNMGQLVDAAYKIITEFIDGIARNIGKIIDSGGNLILKFVEGITTWIRNNTQRMSDAGADLAGAIIDGMANGIANMAGRVLGAIGNVANNALNEAKRILGIHSPSREFFAVGKFTDLGWANGVKKYGSKVVDAHEGVGMTAISTLKKTMSNIEGLMSSEVNMNPTIRPVLDLSAIKRDGAQIDGMLGTPSLAIAGSYDKASALAAADRVRRETARSTSSEEVTSKQGDTYYYTQNNTSPKALSNSEIYRQNKNLISTVRKGAPVAG